jgi:TetR/AcrR family transcriptional regulator, transcriptional repressor for nem operon
LTELARFVIEWNVQLNNNYGKTEQAEILKKRRMRKKQKNRVREKAREMTRGDRSNRSSSAELPEPNVAGAGDGANVTEGREKKTRKRAVAAREELLNAAMFLFWEKGYAETSMADVFQRSGVNAGSMYYYFKSKEQLLLAALDRLAEIMYPALLAPIWEKESDPIERIFGLLGRYRRAILETKFSYGCPVGRLATEIPAEMVEVHAKIAMNFEGWSTAVRKCLEDAGSRLPKGMDLRMLSRFVLTVMEGGVMQSRSYRSIEPFDQAVAQLRDYFDRLESQGRAEGSEESNLKGRD